MQNEPENMKRSEENKRSQKKLPIVPIAIVIAVILLTGIAYGTYRYVRYQRYIANRIKQAEESKTKIADTLNKMNDLKLNEGTKQVRPEPEKILLEDYPVIARINIPSINIDYPIVALTEEQMKVENIDERYERPLELAIVKYDGVNPNEAGNMVIMGHDYRDLSMFGKLKDVKMGDNFTVTDMYGNTQNYVVDEIFDAHRSDDIPKVVDQNTGGKAKVTMFTCTNNELIRLAVRGTKVD